MKRTPLAPIGKKRLAAGQTGPSLKRSPLARRGKRSKALSSDLSVWRKLVREKAAGLCERCGRQGAECHHYLTQGSHPEARLDPRNSAFLCLDCHGFAHQSPAMFRVWFRMNRREDFDYLTATYGGKDAEVPKTPGKEPIKLVTHVNGAQAQEDDLEQTVRADTANSGKEERPKGTGRSPAVRSGREPNV